MVAVVSQPHPKSADDPSTDWTVKAQPTERHGLVPVVMALSANNLEVVEKLRKRLVDRLAILSEPTPASLAEMVYGPSDRREPPGKYRIAVTGTSSAELLESLRAAEIAVAPERPRKTIFLFTGQGRQYRGMGAALYRFFPTFRAAVDQCQRVLVSWGFDGMLPYILHSLGGGESSATEAEMTAMFALEYGLAVTWTSWGVRADMVLGQSLGEYLALVWAGVISLEDCLRLVWKRAKLVNQRCAGGTTGMMVIMGPDLHTVEDLLHKYEGLSVVCYNSDNNHIVGGDLGQLRSFEAICQEKGWWSRSAAVPYAYHTPYMEPILDDLTALGKTMTFSPPTIPIVSTVHGKVVEAGDTSVFTAEYFAHHARRPVLFQKSFQAVASSNHAELAEDGIWLEIGPHTMILPLLKMQATLEEACVRVGSLQRGEADEAVLCKTLSRLFLAGATADWRAVFEDLRGMFVQENSC